MSDPESTAPTGQTPPPPCDIAALYQEFREVKHSINNSMAVIMARAELAQMNATHQAKLIETVLTRGRQVVTELQEYADKMQARAQGK